jgi:uncharacterized protein YkwD
MANPTAQEQEFLELINRMRTAPVAELDLLLNSSDPTIKASIDSSLQYFGTNRATLKSQWDQLNSAAPLAWSSELNQAAAGHNQAMIDTNVQSHTITGEKGLLERLAAAGYDLTKGGSAAENIYAYTESILEGEASLAIDWGNDNPATPELEAVDGIQTPTGHRNNLLDAGLREVGIAVTANKNLTSADVGPLVVTQDFGNRAALDGKAFILGVAFNDKNHDGYYQAGEGISDVKVKVTNVATNVNQELTVGAAGGYQELVDPGDYQVEFTQGGVIQTATAAIAANKNVKLDFVVPDLLVQNAVPTTLDLVKRDNVLASNPNYRNLVLSVVDLGTNLQNGTLEHNLFDFTKDFALAAAPDLTLKTININFSEVTADASYHNYAGLYRIDDAAGTIDGLKPSDTGYMTAALKRSKEAGQDVEFDRNGISAPKNLKGGYIYAPFVVANGTVDQVLNSKDPGKAPHVYCNYLAANADGFDHIKSLGANNFAFEDTFGGGDKDYNDLTFKIDAKVAVIG